MEIAIIDGKTNSSLIGNRVIRYTVINGEVLATSKNTTRISHGTIVSQLVYCFGMCNNIYVLEVLNDHEKGSIEDLVTTLEWCIHKNVDIINMSIGTTDRKDSKRIKYVCEKLVGQGKIIIAAENNDNKPSSPSKFRSVVSVKHINLHRIMIYDSKNNRVFASGCRWIRFADGSYCKTQGCNSYACAFATGIISRKENLLKNDKSKKRFKIIWV